MIFFYFAVFKYNLQIIGIHPIKLNFDNQTINLSDHA